MITIDEIAAALRGTPTNDGFLAHCPSHEDSSPSLSITEKDGRLLVHCFAGCDQTAVIDALKDRGLWPGGNGDGARAGVPRSRGRPPKVKARILDPGTDLSGLNAFVRSTWAREKFGEPVLGSKYFDARGCFNFGVIRYERKGEKKILPVYAGIDDQYHWGQPLSHDRPLLHLPELLANPADKVLVVEGEAKCEAARETLTAKGWQVTTWAGGAEAVGRTDWSTIAKREVVVWPDADPPGLKAALAIARRLPHASVLKIEGRAVGWDVADAVHEGIDLEGFIAACPSLRDDQVAQAGLGVKGVIALGHEANTFYVLSQLTHEVVSFTPAQFGLKLLQTLAPSMDWAIAFPSRDGVDLTQAMDWIVSECVRVGVFVPSRIRGPGAWRDGGQLIYHAGDRLVDPDTGAERPLEQDSARNVYEVARRIDLADAPTTAQEGMALLDLYRRVGWASSSSAVLMLGFVALSPLPGVLTWRPHVWIIGPSGTGKTTIIQRALLPVIGRPDVECLFIQGPATEAGIRQMARRAALQVLWDECEADSITRAESFEGPLFLARQSSSNNGTVPRGTISGRAIAFQFRLMFLFSSTTEHLAREPDRNRVTILAMKRDDEHRSTFRAFREDADRLLTPEWCLRFRTRSVRMMKEILQAIEIFKDEASDILGTARAGDQHGSLLAGAWMATHDDLPTKEQAREYVLDVMADWAKAAEPHQSDAEQCLSQIINATVKVAARDRSIWELVAAECYPGVDDKAMLEERPDKVLRRFGIKIDDFQGKPAAWFAREHSQLAALAGPFRLIYAQRLRELAAGPAENKWFDGRTIRALPILIENVENIGGVG
jgi:putative DNA primase/helicase